MARPEPFRPDPFTVAIVGVGLIAALSGCGGGLPDPDGVWNVTVTSTSADDFGSSCAEGDFQAIEQSFSYQLYIEGSAVDLRIDEELFASGVYADGCTIEYNSPAWLDDYQGAEVQWQLEGTARIDGAAGGCVDEEGLDWVGVEMATIVRSDTEALPPGCVRTMDVTGTRAE